MSASGERSEAAINYKQVEVVEKHCLAAAHGLDSSSYGETSVQKFPVRNFRFRMGSCAFYVIWPYPKVKCLQWAL
jgi:hypothetical protein